MDRTEWLEARRKGIGGTDIAAIVGLSRWKSPMTVYLDKIGATEPEDQNEAMYWGTKLEGVLRARFQEEHPDLWVTPAPDLSVHPKHDFIVGSFDGLAWDNAYASGTPLAGWEGKTASAYKREEWAGSDVPQEYWMQCQWYMGISGLDRWYLSVLIGGNSYMEWLIERDDEAIAMMEQRAVEFWALVESRTPPPIDGTPASTDVLNRLYPADEAVLDPPNNLEDGDSLAAAYVAARAALKDAQGTVDAIENELKSLVGPHAVSFTPGGFEIDWKPRKRTSFDSKRYMEENPGDYSAFMRETEYRAFSVKGGTE